MFLLDEPTNNLDFAGLDRSSGSSTGCPAASSSCRTTAPSSTARSTRIVELQEESHRAVEYAGGWSDYVEQRELARSQQYEAFDRYKAEKSRLTDRHARSSGSGR